MIKGEKTEPSRVSTSFFFAHFAELKLRELYRGKAGVTDRKWQAIDRCFDGIGITRQTDVGSFKKQHGVCKRIFGHLGDVDGDLNLDRLRTSRMGIGRGSEEGGEGSKKDIALHVKCSMKHPRCKKG